MGGIESMGDNFTLDLAKSLVLVGVASGMSIDGEGTLFNVLRLDGLVGMADDRRHVQLDVVLHPEILDPFIRVIRAMEAQHE